MRRTYSTPCRRLLSAVPVMMSHGPVLGQELGGHIEGVGDLFESFGL
jgi:hypothetical protein